MPTTTVITHATGLIRTSCQNIQLLEPCPCFDAEVPTPEDSLATSEGGEIALIEGTDEYIVLFSSAKLSADYDFVESDIANEVDTLDQLSIGFAIEDRTIDGFKLILDALPDTANYVFRFRVQVNEI